MAWWGLWRAWRVDVGPVGTRAPSAVAENPVHHGARGGAPHGRCDGIARGCGGGARWSLSGKAPGRQPSRPAPSRLSADGGRRTAGCCGARALRYLQRVQPSDGDPNQPFLPSRLRRRLGHLSRSVVPVRTVRSPSRYQSLPVATSRRRSHMSCCFLRPGVHAYSDRCSADCGAVFEPFVSARPATADIPTHPSWHGLRPPAFGLRDFLPR